MQVGGTLVHPKLSRDDVPNGIVAMRDGDHLRISGRAGSEVDHHQFIGGVVRIRQLCRSTGRQVLVAVIATRILTHYDNLPQVGALVAYRLQLRQVLRVSNCNGYPRSADPIGYVAGRHQRRSRHRYKPSSDAAQHYFPPLHEARKHCHHPVARLRADAGERVGNLLGTLGEFSISHVARLAVVANPEHGPLVGIVGPLVEYLVRPVVSLRPGQTERAVGLVIVADLILLVHCDILQGVSQIAQIRFESARSGSIPKFGEDRISMLIKSGRRTLRLHGAR